MVRFATPKPSRVAPLGMPPTVKVTDPTGVRPEGDVTVTVKVTGFPKMEGFMDETNPVFVPT